MDRRRFLLTSRAGVGALFSVVLLPAPSDAQSRRASPRVAVLANGSASTSGPLVEAFRTGLRDLGYVDGRNVTLDLRYADGEPDRIPALVRQFLTESPDIVVAAGPQALRAFKQATTSIPVVMAIISDPVEEGLIASLARPGSNLTGLAFQNQALTVKRLELLKDIVPRLERVAVLWDSSFGSTAGHTQAEAAARPLQLRLEFVRLRGAADLEHAFSAAMSARAQGLLVLASPFLNANRRAVVELAARHRLPASYEASTFVEAGGLMSYGPSFTGMYRQAASYVDRLLKGARPADLPVEQPTKFDLAINLKTAKALGLTIPASLLARADQVIE